MLSTTNNPPARFPERHIGDSPMPWWIARVKPRQEKALAFDLIDRSIEYYLPMFTKIVRRTDNNKIRKSVLCLFPGYLSYCADPGRETEIFSTSRLLGLVEVKNQKRFILELEQIYRTMDLKMPIEPFTDLSELATGTQVEVTQGAMKGIRGTIIRMHSRHKLVLSVELLGMAAVSINAAWVKSVEKTL